jgi:endogenous inhibitor of DNA gyrase (YacG/DUF329 family)
MIQCPQTGKPVFTGVQMSRGSFQHAKLEGNDVPCPHCGATHAWSMKNAFLEEDAGDE